MPDVVLGRQGLDADPVVQFGRWLSDAMNSGLGEPTAMTLATATPDAQPSARIVLLKDFNDRGFVFSTNYRSRKGEELKANPVAALLFHWQPLSRQVRIEGPVTPCTSDESDSIFAGRTRSARVGAWASAQSSVIANRQTLEDQVVAQERQLAEAQDTPNNVDVPRPAHWGGYRLRPVSYEFWQGRESRLHDRFRFQRDDAGTWRVDRLAP